MVEIYGVMMYTESSNDDISIDIINPFYYDKAKVQAVVDELNAKNMQLIEKQTAYIAARNAMHAANPSPGKIQSEEFKAWLVIINEWEANYWQGVTNDERFEIQLANSNTLYSIAEYNVI